MCLSLLKTLNETALPVTLTSDDEVDRALLLRCAGLVAALLLEHSATPGRGRPVRVLAITPRGRRVLRDYQGQPIETMP